MSKIANAWVRTVDGAARTALVELEGSEGTAVAARVADHLHPHGLVPGAECVAVPTPGGEWTVVALTGNDPYGAALVGAAAVSAGSPPASFSYTDGVAWIDALTVALTTTGACTLWAHGWLALSANVQSAAAVWEARLSVDGAGAAPWVRAARSSGCNSCASTRRASHCPPPARGRSGSRQG